MSEVVKIVMDKNDLQPLADEVKKLRGGNESITLAQMEDELLSVNDEVDVQAELLVQIAAALEGKAAGGGEQATPEISVNSSNGLITATAGAKSSTYQMAFQPAKTITPSTASQVAVSSGYYTGGNITVAGDSNLISNNIRSGVSIFGVNGTLEEGSMEGVKVEYSENEDAILSGTVSGIYVNDRVTSIKSNAFRGCETLTSVNFPVCSFIDWSAFFGCEALTSINFPVCERIGLDAFRGCWCLTSVDFPACKDIGASAFYYCLRLTSANFPACSSIGSSAFSYCGMLTSINFPMCERIGDGAFYDCSSLTSVNFPVCKSIGFQAFCNCSRLTYANFPMCYWIFDGAFSNCSNLASVSFPACGYIGEGAFSKCISLTSINSPSTSTISKNAFQMCRKLSSLTLGASSVCWLANSNAFSSTPFAGYSAYFSGTPHIYVPASLITAYQSATNWTYFSSYFSSIESLGSNLIAFTINGIEYQAEEGMTWGEWCNSSYNTINALSIGEYIYVSELPISPNNSNYIKATDLIVKNEFYILLSGGSN